MPCTHKIIWALFAWGCLFLNPVVSNAEFYKYVDENGQTHFVDDINNIPDQYKPDVDKYKEKYDDLPPEVRAQKLAEEARIAAEIRAKEEREAAEALERRRKEAEEALKKRLETKVVIRGNQILVPVTMWSGYNKVETHLLLDTGATIIVLHQDIANQLELTSTKKGKIRVAGGNIIDSSLGHLSRFKVGPYKARKVPVTIIENQGPKIEYAGLLGMNFLRNVKYTIDYKKAVIHWQMD